MLTTNSPSFMPRRQLSEGNTRAQVKFAASEERHYSQNRRYFGVFQVCLASEERQTRAMEKGGDLVSGAPHSLRVSHCSPEKPENITPVLEAMTGKTRRRGEIISSLFVLPSSRVTRVFPSLCYLCGKRLATRSKTYPMELCLLFK